MMQERAESSTVLAPAERAWAGSAIFALVFGVVSVWLLPLPPIGILLGMIGIAAALTARGEIRTTTKRGAGLSLAGFMLSLAGCVGGLLGILG